MNDTCPNSSFAMQITRIKEISGQYFFPPLFAIGVIGNILNLTVLNSKGMRTTTNALLSAMAFADLCFFLSLMPLELIAFESYRLDHKYMTFFIYSKMPLTAMTNFFSTSSTWLAMVVTAERVAAIKMPLHAKFYFTRLRVTLTVMVIYCLSFLLNVYNFFWLRPLIKTYCNGTKFRYHLIEIDKQTAPTLNKYVQISWLVSPFFIVYIPLVALIILNSSLLYNLHKSQVGLPDLIRTSQNTRSNEHKVALMVIVIIFSFILLSTPSAILHMHEWFRTYVFYNRQRTMAFIQAATVANLLVVANKACNFVLYCAASAKFRQRLLAMLWLLGNRTADRGRSNSYDYRRRSSSLLSTPRQTTRGSLLFQAPQKQQTQIVADDDVRPLICKKFRMFKKQRDVPANCKPKEQDLQQLIILKKYGQDGGRRFSSPTTSLASSGQRFKETVVISNALGKTMSQPLS